MLVIGLVVVHCDGLNEAMLSVGKEKEIAKREAERTREFLNVISSLFL